MSTCTQVSKDLGLSSMFPRTFWKASEGLFRPPAVKDLSEGCLYKGQGGQVDPSQLPSTAQQALPKGIVMSSINVSSDGGLGNRHPHPHRLCHSENLAHHYRAG